MNPDGKRNKTTERANADALQGIHGCAGRNAPSASSAQPPGDPARAPATSTKRRRTDSSAGSASAALSGNQRSSCDSLLTRTRSPSGARTRKRVSRCQCPGSPARAGCGGSRGRSASGRSRARPGRSPRARELPLPHRLAREGPQREQAPSRRAQLGREARWSEPRPGPPGSSPAPEAGAGQEAGLEPGGPRAGWSPALTGGAAQGPEAREKGPIP